MCETIVAALVCVPDVLRTVLDSSGQSGVYFHIKMCFWEDAGRNYVVLGPTAKARDGRGVSRAESVWKLPQGRRESQIRGCVAWTQAVLPLSLMPMLGAAGLQQAC